MPAVQVNLSSLIAAQSARAASGPKEATGAGAAARGTAAFAAALGELAPAGEGAKPAAPESETPAAAPRTAARFRDPDLTAPGSKIDIIV